jgi:hypothetical protein
MNIVPADPNKPAANFRFVVVENKQENPLRFSMQYSSNPPRLKSVGRINTIYDMHDLMSRSLEIIAPLREDSQPYISMDNLYTVSGFNIDRSIQDYGIYIAPDFPDFLARMSNTPEYKTAPQVIRNAITWGVVRSEPGTVSQDEPFRGTKELKARHREFIACYEDAGKVKIVDPDSTILKSFTNKFAYMKMRGQAFDNLVQYNIWSKTNYEAERLTEWFMDEYMDNYIGMFREAGIVNMYFDRRVRDETIITMKNGYHVRSVLYYIRTERIKPEFIGPIKQVSLNINVENFQSYINDLGGSNIDSTTDKLISRWIQRNQLGG